MLPTFIRLENTFQKAVTVQGSPQDKFFSFRGIHLMSNPPFERGYIQRTYATDGIEIEAIELGFIDICGTELDAGEATFNILRNFNDPDTGLPQVEWELIPNGVDFGDQLVMMKIQTGANVFVYSSPFVLTDGNSEYTSFWAYRNKNQMMHIGLETYRRSFASTQQLDNYTSTSGDIVAGVSSRTKQEVWFTGVIFANILEEFKVFTQCREVYSLPMFDDGLPQRTYFVDEIDTPQFEGDENFIQQEFILNRNEKQLYNPDALPPAPPVPPLNPPTIDLLDVGLQGQGQVTFTFILDNFEPDYLTFQYSLDQVTWQPITLGVTYEEDLQQITTISVLNANTSNFYYRITHQQATSNVLQLPQPSITITNVIKLPGNQYQIAYATANYNPINPLVFKMSGNGTSFVNALYVNGNENPKTVSSSILASEPYFRIDSQDILLSSNVYKYEE